MIKKIQNDAGVRIQFKQGEGWVPPWPRHWPYPSSHGFSKIAWLVSVEPRGGRTLKLLLLSGWACSEKQGFLLAHIEATDQGSWALRALSLRRVWLCFEPYLFLGVNVR